MTSANRDQAEHWNSSEQADRWITHQDRFDRMLAPFTGMILGAAALSPGEDVLDVGCGCGATTLDAARAVAPGTSTGIDLSAPMLARARQNAAQSDVANAYFTHGDAQTYRFRRFFDAVISRFGVMFFADPVAAFANLRTAVRQGGRLAFVCWQPLLANEWLTVPGAALAKHIPLPDLGDPSAPGMFALAEPGRIRAILAESGWHGVSVTRQRIPILVGGGTLEDAVEFLRTGPLGRRVLEGVDAAAQARVIDAVRTALAQHADEHGVHLNAAVLIVRAEAS
jgi:SAM-dependent methyltransferase